VKHFEKLSDFEREKNVHIKSVNYIISIKRKQVQQENRVVFRELKAEQLRWRGELSLFSSSICTSEQVFVHSFVRRRRRRRHRKYTTK